MERSGNPEARLYADYLQKYRTGEFVLLPPSARPNGLVPLHSSTAGPYLPNDRAVRTVTMPMSGQTASGPGILRMAVTAAISIAQFAGSGFKTVNSNTLGNRLRTCGSCEHHTGLRCKVCGCFTQVKARIKHEDCPIGKWPT